MAITIEILHNDIADLKRDVHFIKKLLAEDYELSESAAKAVKEARETPESEYIKIPQF